MMTFLICYVALGIVNIALYLLASKLDREVVKLPDFLYMVIGVFIPVLNLIFFFAILAEIWNSLTQKTFKDLVVFDFRTWEEKAKDRNI